MKAGYEMEHNVSAESVTNKASRIFVSVLVIEKNTRWLAYSTLLSGDGVARVTHVVCITCSAWIRST